MQNYLTGVWKLGLTHAARILNIWNGIYRILPIFFLYLVNAFLGNFKLLVVTTIAYSAGIGFVALSSPPILARATGRCEELEPQCIGNTQRALLYAGMSLIAVGVAGNIVSLKAFINEQKKEEVVDHNSAAGRGKGGARAAQGGAHQLLGLIGVVVVAVAGAIALPYIKPWHLRFGIPAICTAIGTILFLTGSCRYTRKPPKPEGSPLCNVCRVFVAATLKLFRSYPDDNQRYHGIDQKGFSGTSCLRPLHKAAIILPGDLSPENGVVINKWKLCSAAEVEEAKIAVRMVPMWMTFVVCGIVSSVGDTYFVEQASKLNRNIGKLRLPIQVLLLVRKTTKSWLDPVVGRFLKWIGCESAPSFGIAAGMISSISCCIVAAVVEGKRLEVVRSHGLVDKPDEDIPMSMYWLIFQFVLLGGLESFLEISVGAYYRDQSPGSMENYLGKFTMGVSGLGFMCSALLVHVVRKIEPSWFQHTLNRSRFDRYYWALAALSTANLVVFVIVATRYRYMKREEQGRDGPGAGGAYTDGYNEGDHDRSCTCCC
ncbi:hypothetical protein C2S51_009031 [Perilla frutescens var. frutescens]|nr:hypothetical protein C2S51_009031 [Perilla frutescens var. frutescens]